VYEKEFTKKLVKYFLTDLKDSREINLKEWGKRPWHFKVREALAHVFAPML
jgi:hypothetical protein